MYTESRLVSPIEPPIRKGMKSVEVQQIVATYYAIMSPHFDPLVKLPHKGKEDQAWAQLILGAVDQNLVCASNSALALASMCSKYVRCTRYSQLHNQD